MHVATAIRLIDGVIYKPGWKFTADDHTKRFEGAVLVHVVYPAQNSDRPEAPDYTTPISGGARASFPVLVGDLVDELGLYRRLLEMLLHVEEHEAREFFRVEPTMWAPFHPHNIDGMMRWGAGVERDLTFGIG